MLMKANYITEKYNNTIIMWNISSCHVTIVFVYIAMQKMLDSLPSQHLPDICASIVKASYNEKIQVLDAVDLSDRFNTTLPLLIRQIEVSTGKGVLSEHKHFPSGASGQSSLEYKCAYLCLYIRKSSLDYDSIKIFIKISCMWPPHMEIVMKVVQCLGG